MYLPGLNGTEPFYAWSPNFSAEALPVMIPLYSSFPDILVFLAFLEVSLPDNSLAYGLRWG